MNSGPWGPPALARAAIHSETEEVEIAGAAA
jgi:hypothetical protein